MWFGRWADTFLNRSIRFEENSRLSQVFPLHLVGFDNSSYSARMSVHISAQCDVWLGAIVVGEDVMALNTRKTVF